MSLLCFNCSEHGHMRNQCTKPLKCRTCFSDDHPTELCRLEKRICRICKQDDHDFKKCSFCRRCKTDLHLFADCPNEPELRCRRCDGEGHVAEGCQEPRKDDRVCHNCKEPGHVIKNCSTPRPCCKCSSTEHQTSRCPTDPCQKCGEMGHHRSDCPKSPFVCALCRQPGHRNRDCSTREMKPIMETFTDENGAAKERETGLTTQPLARPALNLKPSVTPFQTNQDAMKALEANVSMIASSIPKRYQVEGVKKLGPARACGNDPAGTDSGGGWGDSDVDKGNSGKQDSTEGQGSDSAGGVGAFGGVNW